MSFSNLTLYAIWSSGGNGESGSGESGENQGSVNGLSISPYITTIGIGQTAELTANLQPSNVANSAITWLSSNNAVATVDTNGKVTGVSAGFVAIMARADDGGYTDYSIVIVEGTKVTGISVSPVSKLMSVGQTATLAATISPSDASNKNYTWMSADPNIVSVDSYGKILAKAPGSTIIKAISADGFYTGECEITVNAESINLALNKEATSPNAVTNTTTYAPQYAVDGNPDTRWQTTEAESQLIVNFGEAISFNQIKLSEFGTRITSFRLDYFNTAINNWETIYTGTKVGATFSTTFDTVTGTKVRLYVDSIKSAAPPGASIASFEVYNN